MTVKTAQKWILRNLLLQRLHSHKYLTFMTGPRLNGVRFAYGRRLPHPRHVRRHPRRLRFANRRRLSYPRHVRWHLAYPWNDQWQMTCIWHLPKHNYNSKLSVFLIIQHSRTPRGEPIHLCIGEWIQNGEIYCLFMLLTMAFTHFLLQ